MTNSKQPYFQPNKRHEAILAVLSEPCSNEELVERLKDEAASLSISEEELVTAYLETVEAASDNDVEGAAIGVAAMGLTYPDHDSDEYFDACIRIMNLRCPLLRLEDESGSSLAGGWQLLAEEMMAMIFDGAERIAAGTVAV